MQLEKPGQQGKGRLSGLILMTLAPILLTGCGTGHERQDPLELTVEKLRQEKAGLAGDLEQCRVENAQLGRQIKAMAKLPPKEGDNPYKLTGAKITRYTNFYDKDSDGKKEKLIVYVQPVDTDGDVVKAAGDVSVQLWNLNRPADQALLGQWQVPQAQLHKLWIDTLLGSAYYRLTFDSPLPPEVLAAPLTVKVTFTDYLTGELFRDQHVIKPRLGQ